MSDYDTVSNEPANSSTNPPSTDPSTVSPPPVEGRTDIGEGSAGSAQATTEQAANATTATDQDYLLSKQPSEGREDVAQDLAQEQQQAYSASTQQGSESATN